MIAPGGSVRGVFWSFVATAVAAMLGLSVAWVGPMAFAPILAGGVMAAAVAFPRAMVSACLIAILFSVPVERVVPQATFIDEAAILLSMATVIWRYVIPLGRVVWFPGIGWFAGFVLLGIASSVAHHVPLSLTLSDLYLLVKAILFGFAVAQIPWEPIEFARIVAAVRWVAIAIVVAVLINFAAPGFWFSNFSVTGAAGSRGGLTTPVGPFGHAGFLAQASALLALAFAVFAILGPRAGRGRWAGLAAAIIMLALTLRRKAIVGLVFGLFAIAAMYRRGRDVRLALVALTLIIAVVAAGGSLGKVITGTYDDYASAGSKAPRTVLYRTSVSLGSEEFPLGVGFGRFGTSTAFTNYSPVYTERGFTAIYGLAPGDSYATDTFWPAILGETGWIGLICFLAGLGAMFRFASRVVASAGARAGVYGSHLTIIALVACAWWTEFLFESTAAPVYNAPPLAALLFAVFGVLVAMQRADAAQPQMAARVSAP
jgi:hypothetical protein